MIVKCITLQEDISMENVMDELKNFLDDKGRLKSFPAKRKRQLYALFYLASKFEVNKHYTEKEVNDILNKWHTFEDWALLRRDLYDAGFFNRKSDCSEYRLEENQPTLATLGLVE